MAMNALLLLTHVAMAQEDSLGACVDVGTWFEDVTTATGVRAFGNSLGVNLNDFDGDGDNDLYVATGPARTEGVGYYPGENLLYLNQLNETGVMVFDEVAHHWGVDDLCEDRAPMYGDLDNDGLADLYVTVNGRNVLYRNDGGSRFTDITAQAGAAGHPGWGHQGALFDYDRDGFLDIFFTNGPEDGSGINTLLRNQADGTFQEVTTEAGVAGDPSGKGACVLDADLDGWLDVFVTTGREFGNHLFMNQGDGTFRDEALERGLSDPLQRFGVGVSCEDLDNDGDVDIFLVTHDRIYTGNQLFENDGTGVFTDVAREAGVAEWIDGHGAALIDLDLDGLLDIVLSGIRTAPYVFRNEGDMQFSRLCNGAGIVQTEGLTWAVVGGDLSGDGWPEVYISHGLGRRPRENNLFVNVAADALEEDRNWLEVEAQGLVHNPSAIGARIEVTANDGVTRTRWVGTWSNFDSQAPLPVMFGLGSANAANVTVTFTDGSVVSLADVDINQRLVVVEEESRGDDDSDGVPDDWDACPGTRLGHRTDGEGCAVGQRQGVGLAAISPMQDAVLTEPHTFTWTNEATQAVVQISTDGTFGPAGRIDYGPVSGGQYALSDSEWAELQALSDGSTPMLYRIAGVGPDGAEAITEPRRLYVAVPTTVIEVPEGANIFQPAHVIVDYGTAVTWWNNPVSDGNLQNEPHDVQLLDPHGRAASHLHELNGAGFATWVFDVPGVWHYLCHRHSGEGVHSDAMLEGNNAHHAEGPYRCMAGTVTVR